MELGQAVTDRLLGQDEVAQTRERYERSPGAGTAGNVIGSMLPGSLPARAAGKAAKVLGPGISRLLPGALGRYGTAAASGAVAADTEMLANTMGEIGADAIGGHDVNPEAINQLPGRLLGGALVGGVGGVVGEGLSDAALAYRNYLRAPTNPLGKELPQLEAAGMTTSYGSGIEPSSQVREILERFRSGDPEKGIPPLMGNPVEYAATDVVPHVVNQAVKEQAEATARIKAETAAALASDTNLMNGQKVNEVLDTARGELLRRSQPEAAEKYAPGKIDALGTYENEKLRKLVLSITEAKPVLAVDAAAEAARNGGRLVSVPEARALGYEVSTPGISVVPAPRSPTIPPDPGVPRFDSDIPPPTKSAYTQVEDSDLIGPPLPAHPLLRNPPPPSNAFTTPKDDLPSIVKRVLGPPEGPPVTKAAEQKGRPLPSFAGNLPFPSVPPPPITLQKGVPESEYMVMLTARPYDAQTMESLKDSIDATGKAASRLGDPDRIWKELIAAVRKDRDQFSNAEWSALKEKHHDLLTRLEQDRGHAGITEDELFQHMSVPSRNAATSAITNYGRLDQDRMHANVAVAGLADRAGARPALENMSGTRAYISLKDSAAPQLNLGSRRGLVRSMLAATGLRADAFARDVARGPNGEVLANVKGLNPEAARRTNEPLGRSLLPSSGLLAMGRGALGVRTGAAMDSRTNSERATGTIDPEQQRIIENYLNQP